MMKKGLPPTKSELVPVAKYKIWVLLPLSLTERKIYYSPREDLSHTERKLFEHNNCDKNLE